MKIENVKKGEHGFTLIELLVVIAIIGILAAIAIPQFATYRRQAADGAAKSQLRNMAAAMEGYYVANTNYGDPLGAGGTVGEAGLVASGYRIDPNVTVTIPSAVTPCAAGSEGNSCFSIDAFHVNGTPGAVGTFTWTSDTGGAQW